MRCEVSAAFQSLFLHQSSNLFRPGKFRSTSFSSSWWAPFHPLDFLSKNTKIKIHRTIILPVVLYGCEAWSVTLTEKRRLRVFENRVLRRLFGPKRDEVLGEWRKLHNEELNDLYCSTDTVRVMKLRRKGWAGHVARMGEEERCIQGFDGKP